MVDPSAQREGRRSRKYCRGWEISSPRLSRCGPPLLHQGALGLAFQLCLFYMVLAAPGGVLDGWLVSTGVLQVPHSTPPFRTGRRAQFDDNKLVAAFKLQASLHLREDLHAAIHATLAQSCLRRKLPAFVLGKSPGTCMYCTLTNGTEPRRPRQAWD